MDTERIRVIGIAMICLMAIIRGVRDLYHLVHYTIPQQLAQLVMQAHEGESFKTMWDIRVSPEMHAALRRPLAPEQLDMLQAAGACIFSTSVSCYVLSHRYRSSELSGVVKVSVTVHSKYSRNDLVYPDAKLRIVVSSNGGKYPDHHWAVTSVEQIA